ncbi:tyrosine-type recombinase/integrase [Streptomyces muensis]|uniref:Tyrosine-type recombinase/integrase n=1 Tax=Streptomyces muensis TaxID=1077944 RepID=A0A9X1TKW2_STRM4|nr:tyrosine-type recombinase/integrase [Streptomyces muensis]MCF1594807.1 tyrosine-type recombinase/integrase [Streptomyces muensis]
MRTVAPRYEVLIRLGACAGLRQGEAFGLKRSQVAWKHDLLHIEEQRQRGKAVRLKTKASYATLPVDHYLIERLAHHVSRFSEPEPVSPAAQRRRQARGYAEPPDEDLIVTNRHGRPVLIRDFHQKWRRAVKQAGLPDRTRFHDLKHFYTTTLGGSGKHDPKTVQALSRHAKFSETWDTYAHPPPRRGGGHGHRVRNRVLTHRRSDDVIAERVYRRGLRGVRVLSACPSCLQLRVQERPQPHLASMTASAD